MSKCRKRFFCFFQIDNHNFKTVPGSKSVLIIHGGFPPFGLLLARQRIYLAYFHHSFFAP